MYGGSISEEYSRTMTTKKQHIDAIQSRCDDRLKKREAAEISDGASKLKLTQQKQQKR